MDFWARRSILTNILGIVLFAATGGLLLLGAARLPFLQSAPQRWVTVVYYALITAATLLVTRLYDRMPAAWAGLGLHRWTARELLAGLALGLSMALVAWAPIAAVGGVSAGQGWSSRDLGYFIPTMILLAAGEEVLFRGYLFQRLVEIIGPVAAVLGSALLFALGHYGNPNATMLSTAIIFIGGIFFALCYIRTGSLWLPIGAHAAWNLVLGKVLGLPVSGLDFGGSLLRTGIASPAALTGGDFGPEGGAAGIIALAFGIWALLRLPAITFSPYVYAGVFRAFAARPGKTVRSGGS
ncbi:MAG: CPBP family intramembrane metalloprotease [Bacteroidetes bacterium]|nr:CPBP family intramembrane metalloprotease [Bacteroidota bacterium]